MPIAFLPPTPTLVIAPPLHEQTQSPLSACGHACPLEPSPTAPERGPMLSGPHMTPPGSEICEGQFQAPQPTPKAAGIHQLLDSKPDECQGRSSTMIATKGQSCTTAPESSSVVTLALSPPVQPHKPSPSRTHSVTHFHNGAGRFVVGGGVAVAGWVVVAVAMGLVV